MDSSHFSYPYSQIAYNAGLTPKIYDHCPPLRPQDVYYYAAKAMETSFLPYKDDPISYLSDVLRSNYSLVSIFSIPPIELSHLGKLSYAHDKGLTYEPLTGKLVNSPLTFQSVVFPLGSINQHNYEYVYHLETNFEAKDDRILFDMLSGDRVNVWLNLDLLDLTDSNGKLPFTDDKSKICSSSRKRFESVLMVIGKFKSKQPIKSTTKGSKVYLRKALPKKLRMDLWEQHFPGQRKGTCFTCEDEIDIIAFEAGHIKPVADGGLDDISNLLPLCQACNRSMSSHHLIEWATRYYPKAPALKYAPMLPVSPITSVKKVNADYTGITGWLADAMKQIKSTYPSPHTIYQQKFFVSSTGTGTVKVDIKKYRSKFSHWFTSIMPKLSGPDGIEYQFVTDKDLFNIMPASDITPNDEWKTISKPIITGKTIPVSWIYEMDLNMFGHQDDNTMWGFINSKEFPYEHKVGAKSGSVGVTKTYNSWCKLLKDDQIINVLKYTPNEFVIAINTAFGWNISYTDRNFIDLVKV